jgi:hypothetical protein
MLTRLSGTPTVIASTNLHRWTDWTRNFRAEHPEVLLVRGLDSTIDALRHVLPKSGATPRQASGGSGIGLLPADQRMRLIPSERTS